MSRYTIFIDESGDFGSREGQRVVAGMLVPLDPEQATKKLDSLDLLDHLHKDYAGDQTVLPSLQKSRLHLTEMRRKHGHDKAVSIAQRVIENYVLESKTKVRFLAVIGQKKRVIVDAERTYRLMLLDLVALAETLIRDEEPLDKLDLVVATRSNDENSDNNFQLMTKDWELSELFYKTLESGLESGLVSRGLVELAYGNRFELQLMQANSSWGLIITDFMANLVYNRFHEQEAALLARLKASNSFHSFVSLGKYEERRARIAERDGDYPSALYWWSIVEPKDGEQKVYDEYFVILFKAILLQTRHDSAMATLNSLIERLWQRSQNGRTYTQTYRQLMKLEKGLWETVQESSRQQIAPLLFRLRNFMLVLSNHLGDTDHAERLIRLQEKDCGMSLPFTPENFPLLLDFQLFSIETRVNQLNVSAARDLADRYYRLIKGYRTGWTSLNQLSSTASFEGSQAYQKAATTQIRSQLLSIDPVQVDPDNFVAAQAVIKRIQFLQRIQLHPADASRLRNYLIQAYLRQGGYEEALRIGLEQLEDGAFSNAFDIFWAARAANESLLAMRTSVGSLAKRVLAWLRKHERERHFATKDHPYELIWRERGLMEALIGGGFDVALTFYERSTKLYLANENASPLNDWLNGLLYLHRKVLTGVDAAQFLNSMTATEALNLGEKAVQHSTKESLLAIARAVSPY